MNDDERHMAADVLKAMAHPIRLGVIEVLADGERTMSELYQELGCSQSMMSQQLKILSQQQLEHRDHPCLQEAAARGGRSIPRGTEAISSR